MLIHSSSSHSTIFFIIGVPMSTLPHESHLIKSPYLIGLPSKCVAFLESAVSPELGIFVRKNAGSPHSGWIYAYFTLHPPYRSYPYQSISLPDILLMQQIEMQCQVA